VTVGWMSSCNRMVVIQHFWCSIAVLKVGWSVRLRPAPNGGEPSMSAKRYSNVRDFPGPKTKDFCDCWNGLPNSSKTLTIPAKFP
jgi:hypothetical protein